MQICGLTGGIASGKTSVSQILKGLGAQVVDADEIYHQLLRPQGGLPSVLARSVAERFPEVLLKDGQIDRRRLGSLVFSDPSMRRELEKITHGAVAAEAAERFKTFASTGHKLVVYDVPLLFERGLENGLLGVIVVWVSQSVQIERLCLRDQISSLEAKKRLAAQMDLDDKREKATWVIDNSGSKIDTDKQVRAVWAQVCAKVNY